MKAINLKLDNYFIFLGISEILYHITKIPLYRCIVLFLIGWLIFEIIIFIIGLILTKR